MKALAPAKVKEVRIHEDTGIAEVIVPDFQLSLAIGKEGQNARLAARLTGWRVDIKSESQLAEEESGEFAEGEWIEQGGQLVWQPAEGGEAISAAAAGYAGADTTNSVTTASTPAESGERIPAASESDAVAATTVESSAAPPIDDGVDGAASPEVIPTESVTDQVVADNE